MKKKNGIIGCDITFRLRDFPSQDDITEHHGKILDKIRVNSSCTAYLVKEITSVHVVLPHKILNVFPKI